MGDNLGVVNRPNSGNTIVNNRPNSGNTIVNNRPNSGNTVVNNRPNSGNTIVNSPTNINTNITKNNVTNVSSTNVTNVTNVNRGGYGGGGWGWGGGTGGAGVSAQSVWGLPPRLREWLLECELFQGAGLGQRRQQHARLGSGHRNGRLGNGLRVEQLGLFELCQPLLLVGHGRAAARGRRAAAGCVRLFATPRSRRSAACSTRDRSGQRQLRFGPILLHAGDYGQALKLVDLALQKTPNDPILHEFRAMCLFAVGRYDEAAVPMYTVLSSGPGWDWTTLASLYSSIDVYSQQLRALGITAPRRRTQPRPGFCLLHFI